MKPLELSYGWGEGVDGFWHFYADRKHPVCDPLRERYSVINIKAVDSQDNIGAEVFENPSPGADVCSLCKAESTFDHEYTSDPICPWCGSTEDLWSPLNRGGPLKRDFQECSKCKGVFYVKVTVGFSFETRKPTDEEKESR